MINLTIRNVLSACGGGYNGDAAALDREVSAVTSDSRTVSDGCLFAAIAGERADGHDYIASAFSKGALCALAERIPEGAAGNIITVASTEKALQDIAAFYRRQFDIPFIGITGSVGKTTAKEMIAAVLSQRFCVHKTQGNFNNGLGVPLTIFGLRQEHEAAVIEMGISHFGEMSTLTGIVRPDHAVFTVIGHAHLEYLKDREGVLRAKSEILEGMAQGGTVFVNGDDDLLASMQSGRKTVSFGMSEGCTVRATDIKNLENGETACRITCGGRVLDIRISAYGDHMVYAALEGAAVGIELGLSDNEICCGIMSYQPVGRRARVIETGKITVIDDCYNSNPTSAASAIGSMEKLDGRRVCILGDMLELGGDSAALHFETGELAVRCGAELVLTCGSEARRIADGAGSAGRHFDEKKQLIEALPDLIRSGDVVLVKASRGMRFEEISEALQRM